MHERIEAAAEQFLYRGVHANHPELAAAMDGTAVPGNEAGTVNATEHNAGGYEASSPFTSFTTELAIARKHALKTGEGGIILVAPVRPSSHEETWRWEWSPDEFGEREVLLRGTRTGPGVHRT